MMRVPQPSSSVEIDVEYVIGVRDGTVVKQYGGYGAGSSYRTAKTLEQHVATHHEQRLIIPVDPFSAVKMRMIEDYEALEMLPEGLQAMLKILDDGEKP